MTSTLRDIMQHAINDDFHLLIERLYYRYRDEREYEDFNDYVDVIKKRMPASYTFVKMTKRFALTFTCENQSFVMQPKNHQIVFKRA